MMLYGISVDATPANANAIDILVVLCLYLELCIPSYAPRAAKRPLPCRLAGMPQPHLACACMVLPACGCSASRELGAVPVLRVSRIPAYFMTLGNKKTNSFLILSKA